MICLKKIEDQLKDSDNSSIFYLYCKQDIYVKCCFNSFDLDCCRLVFFLFFSLLFPFSFSFLLFALLFNSFFSFTLVWFYFCCCNHKTVKEVEKIHVLNTFSVLQTKACRLKGKYSFPVQEKNHRCPELRQ